MHILNIIHVNDSRYMRKSCLDQLRDKLNGIVMRLDDASSSGEEDQITWIKKHLEKSNIIITYGLRPQDAIYWIRKAYPKKIIKHIILGENN